MADHIKARQRNRRTIALALLLLPAAATAQSDARKGAAVGLYDAGGVDSMARLRLDPSGTFAFELVAGSLEQRASGRWAWRDDVIVFTSDPRPVPPAVEPGPVMQRGGGPFLIRIVNPSGRDLQGIDFKIDFDQGEPIVAHSLGEAYALPAYERREPRSISFVMPDYALRSTGLPLVRQAGTTATFVLKPNDFGVADFTGRTGVVDNRGIEVCAAPADGMAPGTSEDCQRFERVGK